MADRQLTVASAKSGPVHLLQADLPNYASGPRLSSLCTQQAKSTQVGMTTWGSNNLSSIPSCAMYLMDDLDQPLPPSEPQFHPLQNGGYCANLKRLLGGSYSIMPRESPSRGLA